MAARSPMMSFIIAVILSFDIVDESVAQSTEAGATRRPPGQAMSGPLEPRDALASFELHPNFRIELIASEPLVQDPVAMAFDADGVLYVVEYPEFNGDQFPEAKRRQGRVRRLEDDDGDGRFDRATTFVEVPFATAVICYDGGVFVGAPPDIRYCRDLDDDGVADENRVVLTGFGRDFAGGGLINSFRWGVDNRIHIATGFAGGMAHRPHDPPDRGIDVRGRGVILDPRSYRIEGTSGGGQHGMALSDFNEKFLCSNVYPLQYLSFDDRYTVRNPFFAPPNPAQDINAEGPLARLFRVSPLEPWRVARSKLARRRTDESARPGGVFTSASGITMYRGDVFPDAFRGNLFVGEVANNLVYRATLRERQLSFGARRADPESEFLASRDGWFRPVQFANGPDGALYVVDMYRLLIEGTPFVPPEQLRAIDPSLGTNRGRIYRIVPKAIDRRGGPELGSLGVRRLVAFLEHPNGWHRDTAARLLFERRDPAAVELLVKTLNNSASDFARAKALALLHDFEAIEVDHLVRLLDAENVHLRTLAIRYAEDYLQDFPQLVSRLTRFVDDAEPRVRLQLAFSLGSVQDARRTAALTRMARRRNEHPLILAAIQSSLREGAGDVFAELIADREVLQQTDTRKFLYSLATQIGFQGKPVEVVALLRNLSKLEESEPKMAADIQRLVLDRVRSDALKRVLQDGSIADKFGRLLADARRDAQDDKRNVDRRVESVSTMALAPFDEVLLKEFDALLEPEQPLEVQRAACRALARSSDRRIANMLIRRWSRMSPKLRAATIDTLLTRTSWSSQLLDAVETGEVAAHDVNSTRLIGVLEGQKHPDVARARKILNDSRVGRQEVVDAWRESLELTGRANRGLKVFERVCASCHRRGGRGKSAGPPLDDSAGKLPLQLLTDILDPNRAAKPIYQSYAVHLTDGRVLTGMIVSETGNGIVVQLADGTRKDVLRIEISTLKSTGTSFMPEGLEKQLSAQAMADLLEYLSNPP